MIHPGIKLAAKIKAGGFTQSSIARQLGVAATSFNEILHGKRPLPAAMCVKMQELFGLGKALYIEQAEYEYWLAANPPAPTKQEEKTARP